jgi:hypothetical protein
MALATVLDPRFKLLGLNSEESRANAKALLRAEILLVFSIFSSFFSSNLFVFYFYRSSCLFLLRHRLKIQTRSGTA